VALLREDYDVKLSAVGLRTELLSGKANFGVTAAMPRLDFNRADSIIVCVAMKIRIKNGNTCGPILFERSL
jgi:hypothetical protein